MAFPVSFNISQKFFFRLLIAFHAWNIACSIELSDISFYSRTCHSKYYILYKLSNTARRIAIVFALILKRHGFWFGFWIIHIISYTAFSEGVAYLNVFPPVAFLLPFSTLQMCPACNPNALAAA